MTVRFKPLKCTINVSVHGAFGAWSWAALTSRFIARGVVACVTVMNTYTAMLTAVSPLASQLIMNPLTTNITDIESLFQHYQITLNFECLEF